MPGRPAAQRGDRQLTATTGYRTERRQQRDQPVQRLPALRIAVPAGRFDRLPEPFVVPVAQHLQRLEHRLPQASGAECAVLAQHREQGQHQQAHAVLVLRERFRRAHRAQSREPSGQQVRILRGPAFQRRTGGHPSVADLQQPGRDRGAPGPVQCPDVGHGPQPRRHVHPQGRTRRRHVGLPQHPAGGHRPAAGSDPAGQRDGLADDRAFPRLPRRVPKPIHGVHRGTLLPTWEARDPPGIPAARLRLDHRAQRVSRAHVLRGRPLGGRC